MSVLDLPEREYRALPALSGTGVKALLDSPADYLWEQQNPREATPAMDFGTLTHALTLGTYTAEEDPFNYEPPTLSGDIIVAPYDSFRTAEARQWKALQEFEGKEVVSQSVWATMLEKLAADTEKLEARKRDAHERAQAFADAVHAHTVAGRLLAAPGRSEVSVTGEYEGAPLKGRIDRLPDEGPIIDLKTARSLTLRAIAAAMDDYGYALQLAHYGLLADRLERPYVIAVRNEKRPAVAVYRIGERTWEAALEAAQHAWEIYAECVKTDTWPDPHADRILDVDLPPWALDRLDRQVNGDVADETIAALENLIGETNE